MKKKWITGCVGIFSCLVVVAQQKIPSNLIGRWENLQNQEIRSGLEFTRGDSVFLFFDEEKKLATQVQIDDTKNPFWFDFTINDGTEKITVKSLLVLMNNDLMKWQVFTQEARPAHFTDRSGESMFLKRQNP